jgi:hypothetical protein
MNGRPSPPTENRLLFAAMVAAFAGEFFWKSVRDFRAWIGLVGLVAAGIGGAIGKPIILPTWVWLLIAFASAISMAIRAEWKAYRDAEAQIEPDMKLVDVVKRIVGSDDILVGENCSKTGTALLTIRERGHLGQIAVWARRDVVAEDMDLCPRTSIPAPYWDAFDIDYLKFLDDQRGESKRVRSHPEAATPFTSVWPQDVVYRDFWFSAHRLAHTALVLVSCCHVASVNSGAYKRIHACSKDAVSKALLNHLVGEGEQISGRFHGSPDSRYHAEPQIRPMSIRINRITITRPKPPPP